MFEEMKTDEREREIYRVTLLGGLANVVLLVFKFVAGVLGGSAAMIADAAHSLSDFLTDIVVVVFVRLSSKPQDYSHDYGHGKYETLATAIIGAVLFATGAMICVGGVKSIVGFFKGEDIGTPGVIALVAALVSIIVKESAYRFTVRAGREAGSQVLIANAWHHRSDALSSVGTAIGIGGAIILGSGWAVLDPIAAVVVGLLIIRSAYRLVREATGELLEESLPGSVEDEITDIATEEPQVSGIHNLRTRRIGSLYAIEMHVRMPGGLSLYEAHEHATNIERRLRGRFGSHTYVNIHVEPLKEGGEYHDPSVHPDLSLNDN